MHSQRREFYCKHTKLVRDWIIVSAISVVILLIAEELADLARRPTESLDVSESGEGIVQSVLPLFGMQSSSLRLLQPDGSLMAIAWDGPAHTAARDSAWRARNSWSS
jgi:hypothetical protein